MLTHDALHELATAEPKPLVISIHARTDPRDPANTGSTPAWLIKLRNGLRVIAERLESGDDREARLAFRSARKRIEHGLTDLTAAERARSVAWMLEVGGDSDGSSELFSLQLPLRRDRIVADTKPFVSPLVDIADRGSPTGLILVGGDMIRLAQIEQAEVTEPENSTFELSLGDWRPFGGSAGGSSERGAHVTSHEEQYRARIEAQRDRMFAHAATETSARLESLGWELIVLVAESQLTARFREAMPAKMRERVIAEADLNLVGKEPTMIADAVEPLIEDAWRRRTQSLATVAHDRARSGGAATLGAQETLGALAEGRVAHLLIDPDHDFSAAADMIPPSIGGPAELLGERAVERAIATAAQVTALATDAVEPLREADGMAALLRY
jgi:Bacterial archaeo-eukaryotic release factor family 10